MHVRVRSRHRRGFAGGFACSRYRFRSGCSLFARQAGAVVVDAEGEHAVGARGEDADGAALGSFCDAVFDGVFDHGLQDERGDLGEEEFAGNVDGALEALDEADLLDVEILSRELQFFSERDLLAIGVFEDAAHEVAELDDHGYGCVVSSSREPGRRWS